MRCAIGNGAKAHHCDMGGAVSELLDVLFPHLAGIWFEKVRRVGRSIRLHARLRSPRLARTAAQPSQRVHSRNRRWLADHAVRGQPVVIGLQVRRLPATTATAPGGPSPSSRPAGRPLLAPQHPAGAAPNYLLMKNA
jgi:hypothetical protein